MKVNLIILVLLSSSLVFATTPPDSNCIKLKIYKNKFSFKVNSVSLSYFRILNEISNIKYNISFRGSIYNYIGNSNSTNQSNDQTQINRTERNNDRNDQSLILSVQYFRYFLKSDNINTYLAIGPSLDIYRSINDNDSKNYEQDNLDSRNHSNNKTINKSIGAISTIGFEIDLSRRVGIYGSYDISYYYSWHDNENNEEYNNLQNLRSYKTNDSNRKWEIDFNGFQFGLYILF
jgi:hypothetical protein